MVKKTVVPIMALLILFFSSCGWEKELKVKVKAVPAEIQKAETSVQEALDRFNSFKGTKDFQALKPYADKKNWDNRFVKAQEEITHAKNVYENDLLPLMKEGKKEDMGKGRRHLDRIKQSRFDAVDHARWPMGRAELLKKTIVDAPKMVGLASEQLVEIKSIAFEFDKFVKKAQEKSKIEGWEKEKDLNQKNGAVSQIYKDAKRGLEIAKEQLGSSNPDFALLADNVVFVGSSLKNIQKHDESLRSRIKEMYTSYSKTILDMKVIEKPWKQVVTYQWSNYSEWDDTRQTGNDKVFISPDEFRSLSQQLQSSPDGLRVGSGSEYETLIEDIDIDYHYYHKYTIIENGEERTGDWEEVRESFYEENEDNLGMTILSKPYGKYESEANKVASPPGYDYIAKPEMRGGRPYGQNQYGRWQTDSGGNSFWAFYGQYMFMSNMMGMNHRYDYGYYNDYRTNYYGRSPYYGSGDSDRYGTYGRNTQTNKRYAGSHFSKTGGFKTQDASVRGAGPKTRGGGPGGGGK